MKNEGSIIVELALQISTDSSDFDFKKQLCIANIITALKVSSKDTNYEKDVDILLKECEQYIGKF